MKDIIRKSFIDVRDGHSCDFVVAEPSVNQRFIQACKSRGLVNAPVELNLALLNARKANMLRGLDRSRRARLPDLDDYKFASEIAVRFLERRDQVSLDRILCDPASATEFDEIAARICPGYSSFQYRWAALNLRKTRSLKPEIGARLIKPEYSCQKRVLAIDLNDIPNRAGVYLFYDRSCTLYIGETDNLFKRLKKHLDHSDNKGLARWIWNNGSAELHLEFHVLPQGVSLRQRKAIETELICSRTPLFNVASSPNRGSKRVAETE